MLDANVYRQAPCGGLIRAADATQHTHLNLEMYMKKNALKNINQVISAGPFRPTWDALEDYQVPKWYKDAKFGIFIHWGLYCVPAFGNEWYPRNMYVPNSPEFKHHVAIYGPQAKFGYKDFIPQFRAEKFDPSHWARLFKQAGAKFVVPVAEHHDGFAMYDCAASAWSAAKMGPKRDILGELADAVRHQKLIFGLSSHRAEHWWFFHEGTKYDSDVNDRRFRDFYGPARPKERQPDKAFLDDWLARTCELVDKYRPQVVWFDWWIEEPAFAPYLKRFAAYYYNRAARWKQGVAINYKHRAYPDGTAVFDVERGQLTDIRPLLWQTDTTVSKTSWGYVHGHEYKTVTSLIGDLVDIVSKNGVLLLNIGPKPDGTIPAPEQAMLREIGAWLKINGAAIYGTRPWKVFGEGPTQVVGGSFGDEKRKEFTSADIRFTATDSALYAIALGWPKSRKLIIKTLAKGKVTAPLNITRVELLGSPARLKWTRDANGLTIELPAQRPCEHAFSFRISS